MAHQKTDYNRELSRYFCTTKISILKSYFLVCQCIKGWHDIIERLESVKKRQQSPLIERFTEHT